MRAGGCGGADLGQSRLAKRGAEPDRTRLRGRGGREWRPPEVGDSVKKRVSERKQKGKERPCAQSCPTL